MKTNSEAIKALKFKKIDKIVEKATTPPYEKVKKKNLAYIFPFTEKPLGAEREKALANFISERMARR